MAGAVGNIAEGEGSHNDDETTTVSDQPSGETSVTPTRPAAAVDSSQRPIMANVPTAGNEDFAGEEISMETTNATNDATSDEVQLVQRLNYNDGAFSNFECVGDDWGGDNPDEKNDVPVIPDKISPEATSSNYFDLLGSSRGESTNPSSDVNGAFGAVPPLDNHSKDIVTEIAAVDPEPIIDLLGMTTGKNASSNDDHVQHQICSGIKKPPHHSPTEKKDDVGECATASHEEIPAVVDVASRENQESNSECNDNEHAVSKNEGNSAVEGHASSRAENEGETSVVSPKEEAILSIVASLENKELSDERSAIVEGVNEAEIEGVVPSNYDNSVVEEQIIKMDSSTEQCEKGIDQTESKIAFQPTYVSLPMDKSPSSDATSQHALDNEEKTNNEPDVSSSAGYDMDGGAEERTEEEEEWLSVGLGLGDALRQIVALTEERDSALSIGQEKEGRKVQAEALLVEFQSRLEAEMNRRAESEAEVGFVRDTLKSYEQRLAAYETMEDDLENAQASLVTVVSEKSKLELEVQKLRDMKEASEQKEVVLSNRLNEAKKKEANKSTAAGRLEADNENLRDDLQRLKDELESTSRAKAKLEINMEKLKAKAVERVKKAETALSEERELNEERKKKMKVFVETKAEELREAKESANNMQKELEETRASLRSSRDREEVFQKELEAARLKHRELQRDMERMKRNSEQLHKMGNNLELELEKSANETEEHKKKRMSAKHEIMQMVRTLEAERAVSSKLRESVKFTFTPKALSQQELLTECLRDFQVELERLAAKTGKTLLPTESSEIVRAASDGADTSEINGSSRKSRRSRASKADMDTERLVSNLEQETQHVSKGIMALAGSIERMRSLLDEDYGCMTFFSNVLAGAGEARHQRLGDSEHEENNSDQFV